MDLISVNNDINGLNASVNDGSTSAYMWEWSVTLLNLKAYAHS